MVSRSWPPRHGLTLSSAKGYESDVLIITKKFRIPDSIGSNPEADAGTQSSF